MRLVNTFVTPILLHGLEAVNLSQDDIRILATFHRTLLKQIQGLPERTASAGVYLLVDALPIEAEIDLRVLRFFGAVTRLDSDNHLKQIMLRQLAIKDQNSKSWFVKAASTGSKYGLNLYHHLALPFNKEAWKSITKLAVKSYWRTELLRDLLAKSSIASLATFHLEFEGPNPLWSTCDCNTQRVRAAASRVKLMTGTFPLQDKKAKYNKSEPDPTCRLCLTEVEDTEHFLLRCPALTTEREKARAIRDQITQLNDREWLCLVLGGVTHVRSKICKYTTELQITRRPPRSSLCSTNDSNKTVDSSRSRAVYSECDSSDSIVRNLNICATNYCSAIDRARTKLLEEVARKAGGST